MILVVAGSRSIDDLNIVRQAIEQSPFNPNKIIHGNADGVDQNAALYAAINQIFVEAYPPNYNKYPQRKAPLKRNEKMAEDGHALVAIWDDYYTQEESTGTLHMISQGKKEGMVQIDKKERGDGIVIHYLAKEGYV